MQRTGSIRRLTALAAFLLLLLPSHVPYGLDTTPLLRGEPLIVVRGTVGHNDSLASVLANRLSPAAILRLVEAAHPVYDLGRLSVGRPFGLAVGPDGLLRAFTYGIDELRILRVVRRGDELDARVVTRRYETRTQAIDGRIDSSLFEAVSAAGEQDQLALDIADIFAWDIDFHTEVQRGDSFRVAVEKLFLDGRFARYGRVLAARFVRGDRVLHALFYEGSRGGGYYDLEGRPLRKAFLRSPLRFNRISSRFSRSRLHPILGTRRPHLGVDYAAPPGTPVMTAADGVVDLTGWLGGYGRAVRVRHANGYETLYGHLSRIEVRRGRRVRQGERIGTVGRSGLATGPHLDYRMTRSGTFVDPLRIRLPPAEPIPPREREAFAAVRTEQLALLGTATPLRVADAAAR